MIEKGIFVRTLKELVSVNSNNLCSSRSSKLILSAQQLVTICFLPDPLCPASNEAPSSPTTTSLECLDRSDHKREQSIFLQVWRGKDGKENNTKRYSGLTFPGSS